MSLGGFWDALRGANGLVGQLWSISLLVAAASAVPLILYLFSKRFRSRLQGEERISLDPNHAVQLIVDLKDLDEDINFLRWLHQRLERLVEADQERRKAVEKPKPKSVKSSSKRSVPVAPIRRKSEV